MTPKNSLCGAVNIIICIDGIEGVVYRVPSAQESYNLGMLENPSSCFELSNMNATYRRFQFIKIIHNSDKTGEPCGHNLPRNAAGYSFYNYVSNSNRDRRKEVPCNLDLVPTIEKHVV